jgi:hypothetical protein
MHFLASLILLSTRRQLFILECEKMKLHPVLELLLAAGHHLLVPRSLKIQKRFGGLVKVIPGDLVQVRT